MPTFSAEGEGAAAKPNFVVHVRGAAATVGMRDVAMERLRQIEIGYDAEHDDKHSPGEIARAAACYATHGEGRLFGISSLLVPTQVWPYRWEFKPEAFTRQNYVKAAAMLLAEIDRMDREAATHGR